jgi:hypothetical protein
VNTIRNTGVVGALCLGLAVSGCATTQQGGLPASDHERAPASTRHDGPNAGAVLGAGCARVSIEALRAGPLAVPVSVAIAGVCLPVALGVGILHAAAPNLGLGTSSVPDTGPAALRTLTTAERSVFPDSTPAGCSDCYSNSRAAISDKGPAELRKLTAAERSVFPQSSPAGCSDCYAAVDTGPVEMRKLSSVERSVFPKPSPGCSYGYGC